MSEKSPILYLIRHGEKTKDADGEDEIGLSAIGVDRATGLKTTFGRDSQYNIGYIIAQKPKKDGKEARPYLTVKPLSETLNGVPFNFDIKGDDTDDVATAVNAFKNNTGKYQGDGNVLICWEHGNLEKVAVGLGVQPQPHYPGESFDIIWTIKAPYTAIEEPWTSEAVPGLDDKSKFKA